MQNILLGAAGLDIYTGTGVTLPGQGILHNAYHLQRLGADPLLITRLGTQERPLFSAFFQHNAICVLDDLVYAPGRSVSIDVIVEPSGEAHFANWQVGVWADFRLHPREEAVLTNARHLHLVMIDEVIPALLRLRATGRLDNVFVSADLFDFSFSLDEFARFAPHLDMAFIGWKGGLDDLRIVQIKEVALKYGTTVVFTLGARGVAIFDPSAAADARKRFFAVEPVVVAANTNGCGDAFIAYFLADYWRHRDLAKAVEQGKIGGAAATRWRYALPDSAYTAVDP